MADTKVDPAKGMHLLVAHLIGLPEIVGDDYVAGAWSGSGAIRIPRSEIDAAPGTVRIESLA